MPKLFKNKEAESVYLCSAFTADLLTIGTFFASVLDNDEYTIRVNKKGTQYVIRRRKVYHLGVHA